MFYGLLEALLTYESKKKRGVGLQNFSYDSTYDDFCNSIATLSPSAYHTFRSQFPARLPASFRYVLLVNRNVNCSNLYCASSKRSREPKFPLKIDDIVTKRTVDHLNAVGYNGPVCLACDDTKLLSALRTYYDGSCQQWFLVGSTGPPIAIADNDELRKILQDGRVEKAAKVRQVA